MLAAKRAREQFLDVCPIVISPVVWTLLDGSAAISGGSGGGVFDDAATALTQLATLIALAGCYKACGSHGQDDVFRAEQSVRQR